MSLTLRRPLTSRGLGASLLRLLCLAGPALLLLLAAMRFQANGQLGVALWLGLGGAFELMAVGLLMAYHRTWAPSLGSSVLLCYLAGLAWMWSCVPRTEDDWFSHFVQAVLMVVPLGIIGVYTVLQSGAPLYQRARNLARHLSAQTTWPESLTSCKELPEVKALREALQFDASPALPLLNDSRPQVRICALTALEFRQHWRAGQAESVLALLQREEFPEVRVAAVTALANIDDRQMLEVVAHFLRDPDPRVRHASASALFWDSERRWAWMRFGVRRALGEPALRNDGPLIREGQKLSPEAVDDLIAWSAEKGVLSARSAQTLGVHYARVMHEQTEETLTTLHRLLDDVHAAPLLRIEIARLLRGSLMLEPKMLEALLDPVNPAPLRLIAAEALLDAGPHSRAESSLRDIARLPNRELALATADVVQRRLGVDLGLALGQPLPTLNSPRAIDTTRRLMAWAAHEDFSENVLDTPLAPLRHLSN